MVLYGLKNVEVGETKQETHGSYRSHEKPVPINEYIWGKLWLYLQLYYKNGHVVL